MKRQTGSYLTINNKTIALVILNKLLKDQKNIYSLDDTSDNLINEVEYLSKRLKRDDFCQAVLVADNIDVKRSNIIINIKNWFEEEDVSILGLMVDKIDENIVDSIKGEFQYGITFNEIISLDNSKTLKYVKK